MNCSFKNFLYISGYWVFISGLCVLFVRQSNMSLPEYFFIEVSLLCGEWYAERRQEPRDNWEKYWKIVKPFCKKVKVVAIFQHLSSFSKLRFSDTHISFWRWCMDDGSVKSQDLRNRAKVIFAICIFKCALTICSRFSHCTIFSKRPI